MALYWCLNTDYLASRLKITLGPIWIVWDLWCKQSCLPFFANDPLRIWFLQYSRKNFNVYYGLFEFQKRPDAASFIPLPIVFSPLLLLQGAGVLVSGSQLVEKNLALLRNGARTGRYFVLSARAHDCFGFLYRGSR